MLLRRQLPGLELPARGDDGRDGATEDVIRTATLTRTGQFATTPPVFWLLMQCSTAFQRCARDARLAQKQQPGLNVEALRADQNLTRIGWTRGLKTRVRGARSRR